MPNMTFYFHYKIVDSHWICVNDPSEKRFLCDLLSDYGFGCLPDWITYCLANNGRYSLKYRVFGGSIHLYIHEL